MQGVDVIAEILKREGHRVPVLLPVATADRGNREARHPAHPMPPGAYGHGHRRRVQPDDQREANRCLRNAARPRYGERLSRGRSGFCRQRADFAATGRRGGQQVVYRPGLQRGGQLPPRHEMAGADWLRRADSRADAPGLLPAADGQARPRPSRGVSRCLDHRARGRPRLRTRQGQQDSPRPSGRRRGRRAAAQGRKPRHPRRPGCHVRRGHGRAGAAGRAAAGAGHDHHAGQKRLPREPSPGPGGVGSVDHKADLPISCRRPTLSSASAAASLAQATARPSRRGWSWSTPPSTSAT